MKWILRAMVPTAAVSIAAALLASCEVESAATLVKISPSSVTIKKGQTVRFTASGGASEYTWSLANTAWGTLSSLYGESVTYKSLYNPGADATAVQVLTVSSLPPAGTASGEAPEQWTSEAYITHVGTAVETGTIAVVVEPEPPATSDAP